MIKITAPGICCDCDDCKSTYGYQDKSRDEFYNDIVEQVVLDEGSFSWQPCDTCNSGLGGDRFIAHEIDGNNVYHLDICADCLMELV